MIRITRAKFAQSIFTNGKEVSSIADNDFEAVLFENGRIKVKPRKGQHANLVTNTSLSNCVYWMEGETLTPSKAELAAAPPAPTSTKEGTDGRGSTKSGAARGKRASANK